MDGTELDCQPLEPCKETSSTEAVGWALDWVSQARKFTGTSRPPTIPLMEPTVASPLPGMQGARVLVAMQPQ